MTMASLENKHLPYESKARLAGHVASGTRMTEAELVSATPVDKHSLCVRLSPFSTRGRGEEGNLVDCNLTTQAASMR
jgi:hypothetical protein